MAEFPDDTIAVDTCGLGPLSSFIPATARSGNGKGAIPRGKEQSAILEMSFAGETIVKSFDIDEELVDLLETDSDLADLWEEADQLVDPSEAREQEKEPWVPRVWLDALLKCTDESPLSPAIREMLECCIGHAEASEDPFRQGFVV